MPPNSEPNILFIQTDQHSKHVTGCYGNDVVRTPNVDRLASEGMQFENAYCPAPICVPSRMSFLTSRTPSENRVWDNPHSLDPAVPTWAHVLGAAGYETSLIGRMHFDGPDQRHGFENRPVGGISAGLLEDDLGRANAQTREAIENSGHGQTVFQGYDELVTERAVEYLTGRGPGDRDRPFAAVVSYILPHCPFIAPEKLFEYYYNRIGVPEQDGEQPASIRRFRSNRDILDPPPSEEQVRVARAAYFGLCEYVDRLIGEVLSCLDRTGLSEETLVVYCSDHGEMAGEKGCWWKSTYYEGSVGVPLIARYPDRIEAGSTCDAVVNLMDLGPTFADVAGTAFDTPVSGRSLWPTLRGNHPSDWSDETYSEFVDRYGEVGPTRMIRSGPWKLWDYPNEPEIPPALFNLQEDPQEETDLSSDPEYAEIREELLEKLYADWDPDAVQRDSDRMKAWNRTRSDWHERVDPDYPEIVDRETLVEYAGSEFTLL